jgi:hypothetical protein
MKLKLVLAVAFAFLTNAVADGAERWPSERARQWYAHQPWLVGSNYIPASAINQLEMWQAETFDPSRIERELTWAQGIGMNTMRVFLHNLLWEQDPKGFTKRVDEFLAIASRHGIKPMQLGFGGRQDADPVALGFLAAAVHVSTTGDLVPRSLQSRWHAVPGS